MRARLLASSGPLIAVKNLTRYSLGLDLLLVEAQNIMLGQRARNAFQPGSSKPIDAELPCGFEQFVRRYVLPSFPGVTGRVSVTLQSKLELTQRYSHSLEEITRIDCRDAQDHDQESPWPKAQDLGPATLLWESRAPAAASHRKWPDRVQHEHRELGWLREPEHNPGGGQRQQVG